MRNDSSVCSGMQVDVHSCGQEMEKVNLLLICGRQCQLTGQVQTVQRLLWRCSEI